MKTGWSQVSQGCREALQPVRDLTFLEPHLLQLGRAPAAGADDDPRAASDTQVTSALDSAGLKGLDSAMFCHKRDWVKVQMMIFSLKVTGTPTQQAGRVQN